MSSGGAASRPAVRGEPGGGREGEPGVAASRPPERVPLGLSERATFGALQTEEWGQFLHICDVINATEEG